MGAPWQKSISGVCKFARGRATCKRVVEKFASIARGRQEEEEEEEVWRQREGGEQRGDGCFRRRRRTGEVEGIKRGYPLVVRHCFSSGTSWRMHHLAAFSTALFHSGAVSRILRCRNIGGTWPTGCCQNDVPRTSRPAGVFVCASLLPTLVRWMMLAFLESNENY